MFHAVALEWLMSGVVTCMSLAKHMVSIPAAGAETVHMCIEGLTTSMTPCVFVCRAGFCWRPRLLLDARRVGRHHEQNPA